MPYIKAHYICSINYNKVNLPAAFQSHTRNKNLFPAQAKLFIAVSGGVDSVVLCHLCSLAGYDFTILHCNFKLRGGDSDKDEQFVLELAKQLQAPVRIMQFATADYAREQKLSTQMAARELRYNWFKQVMETERTRDCFLLTAHHKDDDVETMLMNFFKGTGMAGIKGIPEKQERVVRPLLFATKKDLLAHASLYNLTWVEDASNAETKYTRNYFRNIVLPLVKEKYPAAEENLYDNLQRFKEAEQLYNQAITIHTKKLVTIKGEEAWIPVLKLRYVQPLTTVVYEIVKPYGFTAAQTGDILTLLDADTGKYVASSSHRILRNRGWLIISPLPTQENEVPVVIEGEGEYVFAGGVLHISRSGKQTSIDAAGNHEAYLNSNLLQYPLLLRKWKPGDYFYPLGMRKKKKLARFFIDQKISANDKAKIWVLEMNKQIVWVLGHRIDDRFKIVSDNNPLVYISVQGK